jgi:hypothetical protein
MNTKQNIEVLEFAGYKLEDNIDFMSFLAPGGCEYSVHQYGFKFVSDFEPFDEFIDRAYQYYLEVDK